MYKILSKIMDKKIGTENLLIETTYGEYLKVAKTIIESNEYQRKRVKSSSTVYSQLKQDMKMGCIFPSIVLAVTSEAIEDTEISEENLPIIMSKTLILDGLQRTYTLIDANKELEGSHQSEFLQHPLRIELYVKIKRFGILYRMLTLNTGQTPMSLRHQIEILYSSFDLSSQNIRLIKEVEGISPKNIGEYNFKDMIEGFVSYLNSSYLPMTRNRVLETIKSLEVISKEKMDKDLFEDFTILFDRLMKNINNILTSTALENYFEDMENEEDEGFNRSSSEEPESYLFAKDIQKFSTKSQVITGFGAALSNLQEKNYIDSISDLITEINNLEPGGDYNYQWYSLVNEHLDDIKSTSKKIGNSQRVYFYHLFRFLFMRGEDSYLNLKESVYKAKERYDIDYK